jgi:hypothetical protein
METVWLCNTQIEGGFVDAPNKNNFFETLELYVASSDCELTVARNNHIDGVVSVHLQPRGGLNCDGPQSMTRSPCRTRRAAV